LYLPENFFEKILFVGYFLTDFYLSKVLHIFLEVFLGINH
jgi:hypothetical protein